MMTTIDALPIRSPLGRDMMVLFGSSRACKYLKLETKYYLNNYVAESHSFSSYIVSLFRESYSIILQS